MSSTPPATTDSGGLPKGKLTGIIAGAGFLLLVVFIFVCWCIYQRRNNRHNSFSQLPQRSVNHAGGQRGPSQATVPRKTDVKMDLTSKPAGASGQGGPSQARVRRKTDVKVDLTPKPAGASGQPGPSQATVPPKTDVKVDLTPKPAGASGQPGPSQATVPPKSDVKVDLTPKAAGDSGQPGPSQAPPKIDVKVDLTPKPAGASVNGQLPTPGVNSLNITSGFSLAHTPRTFTYDELATATHGFSASNILGQGGFGHVHKGVLTDGKIVAVKQLKPGSEQGETEFRTEVEFVSRVHHRHLVSLVGYCISDSQRMLVYEFVPNKTLGFHLHGKDRPAMEWSTRMKIATGSAKGLAYLLEDCDPRIIHRDIKASNILLDNNFQAKVSDFGLAKFSSDTQSYVSTNVKGTFGYMDPEYAVSGRLTEKSDVYSFGVVLLELITGRKPVDETLPNGSTVEWARRLLSQDSKNINFDALVDPRLLSNYNRDEMIRMTTCAGACVRQTTTRRPKMSLVLRALEGNTSLEGLNEGSIRGLENSEDPNWQLALESQEPGVSEYSGPSREYGQHPSVPTSSGQQNNQEKEMGNVKGSSHGSGMSS